METQTSRIHLQLNTEGDESKWFIMTTLDPQQTEERLKNENVYRRQEGLNPFQYFIPYLFIKRRIAHENSEKDQENGAGGNTCV